jgi:hypothetical protein
MSAQEKLKEHEENCKECKQAKETADYCVDGYILHRVVEAEQS